MNQMEFELNYCPWCGSKEEFNTHGPPQMMPSMREELEPRTERVSCNNCGNAAVIEREPEKCENCVRSETNPEVDEIIELEGGRTLCGYCADQEADAEDDCVHCGSDLTFVRSDGDIGCLMCRGIMPRGD